MGIGKGKRRMLRCTIRPDDFIACTHVGDITPHLYKQVLFIILQINPKKTNNSISALSWLWRVAQYQSGRINGVLFLYSKNEPMNNVTYDLVYRLLF